MTMYLKCVIERACKVHYLPSIDKRREARYDVATLVSRCGVAREKLACGDCKHPPYFATDLAPEFAIRDAFTEQALGVHHIDALCK